MATTSADRIASLDIVRGIAVMGIFSVNVIGMAMIENAYFYPPDFGFDGLGDRITWAANFILVDGKFRSLFSILFGASMVLVVERAVAGGKQDWAAHYPRMLVLLGFGLAHYYLLWWGDILANYALVGMIAFVFWRLKPVPLVLLGSLALALIYLPTITSGLQLVSAMEAKRAPGASPEDKAALAQVLAPTPAEEIAADRRAHTTLARHVEQVTNDRAVLRPFNSVMAYGLETLGLMLLGMAGYKSGFLTGAWQRRSYVRIATVACGASLTFFSISAWQILRADFDPFVFYPLEQMWAPLFHPIAGIGYAALIIVLLAGRSTALSNRIAAVGRAAFTNYLGSTLLGIVLFYDHGFGLYGDLSRGQAWLFAPLAWAIMLLWSKPWLDRFRYGPFEWAWRSLSRGRWEPMRRA
jgi:uncharacterized protein